MLDVDSYILSKHQLIEEQLSAFVPEKNVLHSSLYSAARYSLLGGGKRIRPILTLAAAETLSQRFPHPLSPPCAVEMIHTYSLIHDDLPSMDNDDYRRGKPTLHRTYNEGHAILTGDFLLTRSFELIALEPLLTSQQKTSIIATLAKYAGGEGMIGGQVSDIEQLHNQPNRQTLQQIHSQKTAALITASLEIGGVMVHASSQQIQILREFGQGIGLAFQIVDDVLDVTSTKDKLGKNSGSDKNNSKETYATFFGIEPAMEEAKRLCSQAISSLHKLEQDTSLLEALAKKLVYRNH